MQISQHNYEAFFLMYIDNELSVQEKEMVEAFVKQHPELAGELELLKQTVLNTDETIGFAGKEKLIQGAGITEEDMLTYLDGEAGIELAGKVEKGINNDNALKLELETLSKLYLKADPLVQFPDKEKLYKKAAVRSMDWRKLAIAASLLLCISTWLVLNQSEQEDANNGSRVALNPPPVSQPAEPAPAAVDTNINVDTPVVRDIRETPSSDEPLENRERQRKPSVKVIPGSTKPVTIKEPASGETEVRTSPGIVNNDNANKTSPTVQSPETRKETIETAIKTTSAEPAVPVAAVKEPVKEKKSLFKKLGKQISDRALDILSDGGDNINVAGFAIRLEK